jgi:Fe-S cluster assembly iron-binding protein IscA
LALDEPKDGDKKFEFNGLTFLVEPNLLEATEGIKICWVNHPFGGGLQIEPTIPLGGRDTSACGSCSC